MCKDPEEGPSRHGQGKERAAVAGALPAGGEWGREASRGQEEQALRLAHGGSLDFIQRHQKPLEGAGS